MLHYCGEHAGFFFFLHDVDVKTSPTTWGPTEFIWIVCCVWFQLVVMVMAAVLEPHWASQHFSTEPPPSESSTSGVLPQRERLSGEVVASCSLLRRLAVSWLCILGCYSGTNSFRGGKKVTLLYCTCENMSKRWQMQDMFETRFRWSMIEHPQHWILCTVKVLCIFCMGDKFFFFFYKIPFFKKKFWFDEGLCVAFEMYAKLLHKQR